MFEPGHHLQLGIAENVVVVMDFKIECILFACLYYTLIFQRKSIFLLSIGNIQIYTPVSCWWLLAIMTMYNLPLDIHTTFNYRREFKVLEVYAMFEAQVKDLPASICCCQQTGSVYILLCAGGEQKCSLS